MTTPRKRQFRKLSAADIAILLGEVTTEAAPAPAIKKTAPAIKKTAPKTAAKPEEKTNTE